MTRATAKKTTAKKVAEVPEGTLEERVLRLEQALDTRTAQLRELKINVRTHARDMARQHRLCSVVENTLEAAGLNGEQQTFRLKVLVPAVFDIRVEKEMLAGLSGEQIIEFFKERINFSRPAYPELQGDRRGDGYSRRLTGVEIVNPQAILGVDRDELEFVEATTAADGALGAPPGYLALASRRAQTVHYWSGGTGNSSDYMTSLCGSTGQYRFDLYDPMTQQENLPRLRWEGDSPVICTKCARRAR